jgi:hypothetical protein
VDLPVDDPAIVKRFLMFLYTGDYMFSPLSLLSQLECIESYIRDRSSQESKVTPNPINETASRIEGDSSDV